MQKALTFLFFLGVAIGIGVIIYTDPGYLYFTYHGWQVEMPLWLAIAALALFIFTLYLLSAVGGSVNAISDNVHKALERARRKASKHLTEEGLINLAEGRWEKAEKLLLKAANKVENETPLINYLSAAKAAQELGADDRRDKYLHLAHDAAAGTDMAVGLTQAELQFKHQQYEQSLATLKQLKQLSPKHVYVLKMLHKVYLKLQDWKQLAELLPDLKKTKAVSDDEIEQLEALVYDKLLQISINANDLQQLNNVWQQTSKLVKSNPRFVFDYATALNKLGNSNEAEELLKTAIKNQWNDRLVKLYGTIDSDNSVKQFATAESWLKLHQQNPVLLLTLGRIAVKNKLWGKAKDYLLESLNLEPLPETYCELGKLLEVMGEDEQGVGYYRQGLLQAVESPLSSKELEVF